MKTNEFSIGILIVEFSSFFRGGGGVEANYEATNSLK